MRRELRKKYIDEVNNLKNEVEKMRKAGKTPEEIARKISSVRREIGIKYKNLTPQKELEKIYERNLTKYKDKYGPTVDYLRNTANKSWEEIIESATRTGGTDLGL
jgi:uncharacterized protein YeaO (DUF488 family)